MTTSFNNIPSSTPGLLQKIRPLRGSAKGENRKHFNGSRALFYPGDKLNTRRWRPSPRMSIFGMCGKHAGKSSLLWGPPALHFFKERHLVRTQFSCVLIYASLAIFLLLRRKWESSSTSQCQAKGTYAKVSQHFMVSWTFFQMCRSNRFINLY